MHSFFQPLIVRTGLMPDECLLSLVNRLAHINYHTSPRLLEGLIREDPSRPGRFSDNLEFPLESETYSKLAALTMLDPLLLYRSTCHRFAAILTFPPSTFRFLQLPGNISVPRFPTSHGFVQIRHQGNGQFCPTCLKDAAYYPLHWIPVAASACLRHQCLLVDRCQACGAGISTRTVIQARCRRCLADITKAKTISIADDEAGLRAQRIIQSWFMENATPGEFSLPEQSPAVLYRIVDGLQRCMRILGDWDWPYLHHPGTKYHSTISEYRNNGQRLSVYESYRLYTTAFRGLMDWPKGFYDFLNNYRQKYVQHSPSVRPQETGNAGELVPGSIQDNLGALYILWIRRYWTSPAYDFLQEAFKRYIAENYLLESSSERTSFHRQVPELAGRLERVSISEACHILKTTPRTMELLVKSGQLTDRSLEGSTDLLLDRREVLSLRSIWIDPLPLKQVAVLLGVTQELVGDLVETGLLSSGQMPPHYLAAEQVTRTSVIGCLERVTKYTKDRFPQNLTDENIWLNALEAARLLVLNGIDAVTLFLWIVGGNLWACLPAGSCFQLESLLFARIDVQACLESIDVNDNLISRETAAMHLGIREVVLARWVRSGLIAPRAVRNHIHYFDRTSLDNFMMSYVADDKVTILDLDSTTRHKWAQLRVVRTGDDKR